MAMFYMSDYYRRSRAPRRKTRVTRGSGIMLPAAMALGSYMVRRKFRKRKRRGRR